MSDRGDNLILKSYCWWTKFKIFVQLYFPTIRILIRDEIEKVTRKAARRSFEITLPPYSTSSFILLYMWSPLQRITVGAAMCLLISSPAVAVVPHCAALQHLWVWWPSLIAMPGRRGWSQLMESLLRASNLINKAIISFILNIDTENIDTELG